MSITTIRQSLHLVSVSFLLLLMILFILNYFNVVEILDQNTLKNFKNVFVSLLLEAFPFILLGVFVSALIQSFVTEKTIQKILPKNPILSIMAACGLGIVFPLCECGMIPIIRRLIQKGLPIYVSIVFILAGPILNPVVFTATFMAFRSQPEMAYSRMLLAFIVAFIIGLWIYRFYQKNVTRETVSHIHSHSLQQFQSISQKIQSIFTHASDEFFEMGKYLIIGAVLTSTIQTLVERESLMMIGQGEYLSHLFMMGFAYILSICSTSDAFIAASFTTTFTSGSLLTFLVFGPMLDIKGTLMLLTTFKARFVLLLSILIFVVVFLVSVIYEKLVIIPYF